MSQNLGTVWYEVDADTAKLIEASRRADAELGKLGSAFDKSIKRAQRLDPAFKKAGVATDELSRSFLELGRRANGAIDPLRALQGLALGYVSFNAAKGLADMADNYRAMGERVRMATDSMEEFNHVQDRLFESANKGKRPIEEAQELFITTSGNLKELGFTVDEAIDITDSMSYAFVRNATSSERAAAAIRNYDAALSTGKVNRNEWMALSGAMENLNRDIARHLGITALEVDALGVAGEITAKTLNEVLLKSLEDNRKAADSMVDTVQDGFTKLSNNFKRFIGEANQAHGATDIVTKGLDLLAENLNEVSNVLLGVGAVALARYIGGLSKSLLANKGAEAASLSQAKSELHLAVAHEKEAKSALAAATANANLGASHTLATNLTRAQTAAVITLQKAYTATISSANRLMGFLGGPAGLAFLAISAAAAFIDFSKEVRENRKTLDELGTTLKEVTENFEKMGRAQQKAAMVKYLEEEKQAATDLSAAYKDLQDELSRYIRKQNNGAGMSYKDYQALVAAFEEAEKKGEDVLHIIEELSTKWGIPQEDINSLIKNNKLLSDLIASYKEAQEVVGETSAIDKAAQSLEGLNLVMGNLPQAIKKATDALKEQKDALAGIDGEAGRYLKSLKESNAAYADKGSEVGKVERMIARLREGHQEVGEELEKQLLAEAALKDSQKGLATSTNQNAQVISNLRKEISLTALSAREYAIAKAEASLTDVATQDEINKVRELAAALYEAQQIASRKAKFGETGIEADKYILGDTNPLSGGMFDDQYARYEAEAVAEQERYAAQLERLKEAKELQIETAKDYYALEEEAAKTHADRMAQIETAKAQLVTQSVSSMFGSIADVLEKSEGEQSKAYKAMFAMSKAFSLAQTLLALPTAISEAMKLPWPENLVAAGIAGTTVMAQIASVKSASFGGGRQYGGPVAANKMYRVNETGQPEIFNAANGQQFFLPNQRGDVVPAGKNNGGNSTQMNVTVNLHEDASKAGRVEQKQLGPNQVIDIFVESIARNGKAAQVVERAYGLRRQGY